MLGEKNIVKNDSFYEALLLSDLVTYHYEGYPDLDNITIKDLSYFSGLLPYTIRKYLKVLSNKGDISI
jgi:hypothetical protein